MADLYYLYNSAVGWRDLPPAMRPAGASAPTSGNLVRARGHTVIHNLADGLPDPVPVQLTGLWDTGYEELLSSELDWWTWFVTGCTEYRRGDRPPDEVRGSSLIWAPVDDDSSVATVTITLIPARVRNPATAPSGAFKGF